MIRAIFFALLAIPFALPPRASVAATVPIQAIPESAIIVIRFRRPEDFFKKVAPRMAKNADKSALRMINRQRQRLGQFISNPAFKGIDSKKDYWLAILPSKGPQRRLVFGIPPVAKKKDELRTAVGYNVEFITHGKWEFYSSDISAMTEVRNCINGNSLSIDELIDEDSKKVLMRSTLGVFVNIPAIRKQHAIELQIVKDELRATLASLSETAPQTPGMNLAPVFQMYGDVVSAVLQGIEDSESLSIGITVSGSGIAIEEILRVTPDSPTDKYFQSMPPSPMRDFAKLPDDQLLYVGMHGFLKKITKWGITLSQAMLPEDDEKREALKKLLDGFTTVVFDDSYMTFNLGDLEGGPIRSTVVTEVDPIDKMRELTRSGAESLAGIKFGGVSQQIALEIDAEKFGEFSADILTMQPEFDEESDPLGMSKKMMETMYGPDGIKQRTVYLDDKLVQTTGGGRAEMTRALMSLKKRTTSRTGRSSRSAKKSPVETVRGKLTEKANFLILADVPQLIAKALKLAIESGAPIPIDETTIDGFNLTPSYLGFSLSTEPGGIRAKTFIPLEQVISLYELRTLVDQMMPKQPQL